MYLKRERLGFLYVSQLKYLHRVVAHFNGLIDALHDLVEPWRSRN